MFRGIMKIIEEDIKRTQTPETDFTLSLRCMIQWAKLYKYFSDQNWVTLKML